MKTYEILKTFNGSQDGLFTEKFTEDTTAELSDDLAAIVVKEGWAKLAKPGTVRETKVAGPDETKPFDITTLDDKQLVKFAKDNFGLKLDVKLGKDKLLAAIDAHTKEKPAA